METSQYSKKSKRAGFSLLEVVIAITVLAVGLSALAGLIAQCLAGTNWARYTALATTLTSEKLEDLNRWDHNDSHVAAGGSLTADTTVGTLNYYDDIDLSDTSGQVSETVAISGGYSSVIHQATGVVTSSSNTSASAPSGSGTLSFHRRWLVESNPVVNGITMTGIRRVTVEVTMNNSTIRPAVNSQISLVRP